ncbi:hypothetical protein ACWGIB_27635 [Streptomyces xiamenensis]
MSPSSTTPTMTELHTALGSLLEVLADVPEVQNSPHLSWRLGYTGRLDGVGIEGALYAIRDRQAADRIADLLGLSTRRTSTRSSDGDKRLHEIHGKHAGVPVVLICWLPEPTEREQLLARLAELDAAEADTEGGAA